MEKSGKCDIKQENIGSTRRNDERKGEEKEKRRNGKEDERRDKIIEKVEKRGKCEIKENISSKR